KHLDAERLELRGDKVGRAVLVESQFGMRVQVAPPALHLVLRGHDVVDERHGCSGRCRSNDDSGRTRPCGHGSTREIRSKPPVRASELSSHTSLCCRGTARIARRAVLASARRAYWRPIRRRVTPMRFALALIILSVCLFSERTVAERGDLHAHDALCVVDFP